MCLSRDERVVRHLLHASSLRIIIESAIYFLLLFSSVLLLYTFPLDLHFKYFFEICHILCAGEEILYTIYRFNISMYTNAKNISVVLTMKIRLSPRAAFAVLDAQSKLAGIISL